MTDFLKYIGENAPANAEHQPKNNTQKPGELSAEEMGRVFRSLSSEWVGELDSKNDDTWAKISAKVDVQRGSTDNSMHVVPPPRSRGRRYQVASMVALAACALLALAWPVVRAQEEDSRQLSYVVEEENQVPSLEDGAWDSIFGGEKEEISSIVHGTSRLVASEELPVTVRFSDESSVTLLPHTTLRLMVKKDGAVRARLAQGSLEVDVHHQQHTDYRFGAGPYEVRVVGTKFILGFIPNDDQLDLKMTEGEVLVADHKGHQLSIKAGEELHLLNQEVLLNLEKRMAGATRDHNDKLDSSSPSAENILNGSRAVESANEPDKRPHGAKHAPVAMPSTKSRVTFRALAAEGKFAQVVSLARGAGVSRVLSNYPASELQELAQAARYAGETALAARTWRHMQQRFAGTTSAANATFFLGRLMEQSGQTRSAIQYYRSYLQARGSGVYGAEALGRQFQLVRTRQGSVAARPLAHKYMKRYPKGAYFELARRVIEAE